MAVHKGLILLSLFVFTHSKQRFQIDNNGIESTVDASFEIDVNVEGKTYKFTENDVTRLTACFVSQGVINIYLTKLTNEFEIRVSLSVLEGGTMNILQIDFLYNCVGHYGDIFVLTYEDLKLNCSNQTYHVTNKRFKLTSKYHLDDNLQLYVEELSISLFRTKG
ncbi:hypothetical protein RF11_04728 [Thelohanellus kitauei]|uniref:Uncharacterized protein n=1 Tax=Thelohanellus kitauei TaxID=669202 RepID=A0A0C2IPT0_THEKT|nr:hypothetical protein RF11_04728 [Thelohanellus kitauei]